MENGATANAETSTPDPAGVVNMSEAALTEDESPNFESTPSDFGARVATGPLAARTAAPLGPSVSSVMLELAPAIDRHERALSQEIAAEDADEGQEARASSIPLLDADAIPTRRGDGGDSEGDNSLGQAVVAVAGLGPVHLKVSAAGIGDRRGGLAALHAALSDPIRPADGLAGVVAEDRGDDPVLVALVGPASSDGAHRPTPDFLTSAFILALGMGLVTGPVQDRE